MVKILLMMVPALFLVFSCVEKEPEQPGPSIPSGDNTTVVLERESGSTGSITAVPQGNWTVVNNSGWFSVNPSNGFAGECTLTVTAQEANEELAERVGSFGLADGGDAPITFYVVQKGVPGMSVAQTVYNAGASAGRVSIEVQANTDFTATESSDWMTVAEVEYGADSVLLEDGKTWSGLRTSYVHIDLEENTGTTSRSAQVGIVCGEQTVTVDITQLYHVDAEVDWKREFYRQSLFLKFTGTGCGYCPRLTKVFANADEKVPGRMVECNIHSYADDGVLYYPDNSELKAFYGVTGHPRAFFNSMVDVENPSSGAESMIDRYGDLLADLVTEACGSYPAKTAIQASSTLSGNALTLNATVAAKEQQDYRISAFVLEDGIIADQKNYDGETLYGYEHNAVMRYAVTEPLGESLGSAGDRTFLTYSKTVTVPDGRVADMDNAYVVIWISYAGSPDVQEVPVFPYVDLGWIVDNAVVLPLNGNVDFRYED